MYLSLHYFMYIYEYHIEKENCDHLTISISDFFLYLENDYQRATSVVINLLFEIMQFKKIKLTLIM